MKTNSMMKDRPALLDDVNTAIRDNPLAAGLIGLGAAWFLFGGARSMMPSMVGVANAARKPTDAATEGFKAASTAASDIVSSASETLSSGVRAVADTASGGLSQVTNGASEQASRLKDYAGSASQTLKDSSGELLGTAQDNLRAAFERQPLLIGLAGAAVGLALASAFPRSKLEEEWMGGTSDEARRKASEFASEAGAVARRVIDEVSNEAQAQGLTGATVSDAVSASREKLSAVGSAATSAFKR